MSQSTTVVADNVLLNMKLIVVSSVRGCNSWHDEFSISCTLAAGLMNHEFDFPSPKQTMVANTRIALPILCSPTRQTHKLKRDRLHFLIIRPNHDAETKDRSPILAK